MAHSIVIRNVPDDVYSTLRERAASPGMSISEYLLAELERIAGRPTVAEVIARAQAVPGGVSTDEIVKAVRAGRDDHD